MTFYIYRMDHDRGLAPSPFFRTCSLAVCMGRVRKRADLGDVVIGTSSYARRKPAGRPAGGSVVFAMDVTGITCFQAFRGDFPRKRPDMHGSRLRAVGDAIYWHDGLDWRQDNSLHSDPGGVLSCADLKADVLDADRILLSTRFTYWGALAPALPAGLARLGAKHTRLLRNVTAAEEAELTAWLAPRLGQGRLGKPIDWLA